MIITLEKTHTRKSYLDLSVTVYVHFNLISNFVTKLTPTFAARGVSLSCQHISQFLEGRQNAKLFGKWLTLSQTSPGFYVSAVKVF